MQCSIVRAVSFGTVVGALLYCCTGCVTVPKETETRLVNLENRVAALEEQQAAMRNTNQEQQSLQDRMKTFLNINDAKIQARLKGISFNNLTVKQGQIALKNAGFYKGEIDGKVGGKTREAIMEFQKKNNLKVDGIIGEDTWSLLSKYYKE